MKRTPLDGQTVVASVRYLRRCENGNIRMMLKDTNKVVDKR